MLHLGRLFAVAPPGHSPGTMMAHAQHKTGERSAHAYCPFTPEAGEWRQLGVAWDSRSLSLVVDGTYRTTAPLRYPFQEGDLSLSLVVAGWGGSDHEIVVLDEVTIYNRLLSRREIRDEYLRLKP